MTSPTRLHRLLALCLFAALGGSAFSAPPDAPPPEYPFGDAPLSDIRQIASAEASAFPLAPTLMQAWSLYLKVQGNWLPGHARPTRDTVAEIDALKARLLAVPSPSWFTETLTSAKGEQETKMSDTVGDAVFVAQAADPGYQRMKALALLYLCEHELNRPGSANNAGRTLTALLLSHPWDWEVQALYSRLLLDAKMNTAAFACATQSIYLNPKPSLADLEYFAFIGCAVAKDQWPAIQDAIRAAAPDAATAERAIADMQKIYSAKTALRDAGSGASSF